MRLASEFKQFVARGNVIDLAVAVVMGAAFTKIVSALVDGIVMPVVGALLPGGDWRTWTVTPLRLQLGGVLAAIVDFLLVALVVFVIVRKVVTRREAPKPATRTCPQCLESVPAAATRCRACAQPL